MITVNPDLPLYEIIALRRAYDVGGTHVHALAGVNLSLSRGELVAIEGTSGSGKSTLLAILGGLDRPTSGAVRFDGADMSELSERDLTALRGRDIGFVFQNFNLIPTLNALQNVMSVMGSLDLSPRDQRARALQLLAHVGLAARADHLPSRMSGGEQQRVAIARALANSPRVVLADEPTGNLDSATAEGVMDLLRGLGESLGVTVVLVTHDPAVAIQAPRRICMRDGRIVSDRTGNAPTRTLPVVPPSTPALHSVISAQHPPRTPERFAALIGQAAALVALAGVAALTLSPQTTPAASHCTTSCRQRPHDLALLPRSAPLAPSHIAVPLPVVSTASTRPKHPTATGVTRPVQREPLPTRAPAAAPPRNPPVIGSLPHLPNPVVKQATPSTLPKALPKPVTTPDVQTTVPAALPPAGFPGTTASPKPALTWSPIWGWTGNSTIIDLITASMMNRPGR
jgi:putative ABC transport system ATP-binding protein